MNRLYKSFFSKQLGRFVVTSEKARTKTKSSKTTTVAAAVVATLGITFSAGALADTDIDANSNEVIGSPNTVIGEYGNVVVGKYNGVSGNDNNVTGLNNKSWDIFSEEANEDENSAVFDFFNFNNSNGEPTDGNNIFGAENYYRGYGNVITGQSNLVSGDENDTVGTGNQIAGKRNATFGQSNTTSGYQTVNVGLNNSVDQAHRANIFGNTNESVNDKITTVIGERNDTRDNAESFVAGTNNQLGSLYGTNVIGLNNNVFSAQIPEMAERAVVNFYDPRNPGYWVDIDVEGAEVPEQQFYPSGKTNVFGADNNITSSYTTVVGNNNKGQNALRNTVFPEPENNLKLAVFASDAINFIGPLPGPFPYADFIAQEYYQHNTADNSVVTGNDNAFGSNTSIHGLSNDALGRNHNVTGSLNTTYGTTNNIHGTGNRVGEVRHERIGNAWTPVEVAESRDNSVVGAQNTIVGDANSILGNNNQSQYTTQPPSTLGPGEVIDIPALHKMAVEDSPMAMASPMALRSPMEMAYPMDMVSLINGENTGIATNIGALGFEEFNQITNYSAVVGSSNYFGDRSNILGSANISLGVNNSAVGNENSQAGTTNNTLGSGNFTGGVQSESIMVRQPDSDQYQVVEVQKYYASSDVTAVGNNNKAIGLSHAIVGNSNTLMDAPGWQNDFNSGINRILWDKNPTEDGRVAANEWLNSPSSFGDIDDIDGGYYSNVLGSYNNIGATYSTTLGNSNIAVGHSINTIGNMNEIGGTNSSVVGNANMISADRTNIIGNNNWNGAFLYSVYDIDGETHYEIDEVYSNQYVEGLWEDVSNEYHSPYEKINTGFDLMINSPYFNRDSDDFEVNDSDIFGSHNIVMGENLLVVGQANLVEGARQTVIGHDNIATGEKTVALGTDNTVVTNMLPPLNISEEEIAKVLELYPQMAAYLENSHNYTPVAIGSENNAMNGGIALGTQNQAALEGISIGRNNAAIAGNIALGSGVISIGETLTNEAFYIGGTATNQLAIGSNGNDMRITGVAAGSNPNDAVNVEQLTAVVNDIDPKGNVKYKPILDNEGNNVLDEKGLKTYDFSVVELATKASVETEDKYNVSVVEEGTGTVIENVGNATQADHAVNKGQLDYAIAGVQDGLNGAVKYERDAEGNINFDKAVLEGTQTVTGADTKYVGVQVVKSGGTVIDNVANATEADHAVNKGQLDLEIAGVKDGLDGAVKYERDAAGNINFNKAILQGTQTVIGADTKYVGVQVVKSGGTVIDNVANATEADHAVNKGQLDLEIAGVKDGLDGAVKYERDADGNINFDKAVLEGTQTVIAADEKYKDVQIVKSGGTVIDNVANATEADHAVNKGQMDVAIAGVQDGLDGTVKYGRDADGKIDFTNVILATETVKGTDDNGTDYVVSGGSTINNVATATEYHQAINKGQFDQGLDALRDGAVMYALNGDGTVNKGLVNLAGTPTVINNINKYGVSVVASGGTVLNNVANGTEADHAVNKGQLDFAIAGVNDGLSGTVKYERDTDGNINFDKAVLEGTQTVIAADDKYKDVQIVKSGGTVIDNVANATEADHAVNKGQMDVAIAGVQDGLDGTVKYGRDGEGKIDFTNVILATETVKGTDANGTDYVKSGGSTINNVATATEYHQAINKGQFDQGLDALRDGAVMYALNGDGTVNKGLVNLAGVETTIDSSNKYNVAVVTSGGTVLNNVANATEADHAVNKGQMDFAIAGVADGINGAVKYERDAEGNINFDKAVLEGTQTVIAADAKYKDVQIVKSGGTVIDNVANATEADHAVNKGQMDVAIAGVQDGLDGTVKYGRDGEGKIDFTNVILATETVKGTDANGTDYVKSGGSTINNVATATEYHQAINKGQFDQGLDGIRNGAVMYALNVDGSVNKDIVNLMGTPVVAGESYGVQVAVSGGTVINNVAKATEFHQAINKGQLDEAIAQVYLENDGASVKYDVANGGIDYKNVTLKNDVVAGTDQYGVEVVASGGTNINNVATATQYHQAVNKGQMDSEFAKRDDLIAGAVQYDRNSDNSINYDQVTFAGEKAVTGVNELGVEVVTSGGTVLANVGNATEAHHAINKGMFDDAIARLEAETEGTVKYDKNTDGTIDYSNITLAGETAVVEKNADGVDVVTSGGTTINNVATATEAHQAINKGQFDEALSKIEGESAGNVKYDKNADGSVDYNNVSYAGDKAVVEKNDLGIDVVTSGGTTLKNIATATQADEAINKGQFDDGLARLEDGTVQYARNEDGSVNKNSVVLGGDKTVIAKNEAGIEVVKSGGTVISNVAVATQADHAINKGQFDEGLHQVRDYADQGDITTLHNANNYTDNRVDALWDAFQDESKDLRAGIAGAMAVGNLPQPSEAGYSMFSMGVATYKGQQAIAMGLSAVTEDKRYIFKIAATTTSRNDTGGAASVGMQWK